MIERGDDDPLGDDDGPTEYAELEREMGWRSRAFVRNHVRNGRRAGRADAALLDDLVEVCSRLIPFAMREDQTAVAAILRRHLVDEEPG